MRQWILVSLVILAGCTEPNIVEPEFNQLQHPSTFFFSPIETMYDYDLQIGNTSYGIVTTSISENTFLTINGTTENRIAVSYEIAYQNGQSWTLSTAIDADGLVTNGQWNCNPIPSWSTEQSCAANSIIYGLDMPGMKGLPALLGSFVTTDESWVKTGDSCPTFEKNRPLLQNFSSILTPTWGKISFCEQKALPTLIQQDSFSLMAIESSGRFFEAPFEEPSSKLPAPNPVDCQFELETEKVSSISSEKYVAWAIVNDPFFQTFDEIVQMPSLAYSYQARDGELVGDFRFNGPLILFDTTENEMHIRKMLKHFTDTEFLGTTEEYENSEEERTYPIRLIDPVCYHSPTHIGMQDPLSVAISGHGRTLFKNVAPNLGLGWQGGHIAREPFIPLYSMNVDPDVLAQIGIQDPRVFAISQTYQTENEEFGYTFGFLKAGIATLDGHIQAIQRDGWNLEV
jgi:hypothetical protein